MIRLIKFTPHNKLKAKRTSQIVCRVLNRYLGCRCRVCFAGKILSNEVAYVPFSKGSFLIKDSDFEEILTLKKGD